MASYLKSGLVLCLLLSLIACGYDNKAAKGLQVKAIDSMERYAPFAEVKGKNSIELQVARNEYEGFQLVITAKQTAITNVRVEVTPLKNTQGDTLDQLQIFRERYIPVTTPSPFSPYPAQWWPDILLPASEGRKAANSTYQAFPQNLTSGENLPVWVDLYVPMQAKPSIYNGEIVVKADKVPAQTLPISVQVWNFSLPERSPLRTVFGTNGYRIAELYGFERTGKSVHDNQLVRAYNDFLLDHHLSPESFWDATPERGVDDKPDFKRVFAGLGTVTENMRHYMQEKKASAYTYVFADSYPFKDPLGKERKLAQQFMQVYAQWCAKYAGAERCYTDPSFVDEPDSKQAYDKVREWGQFFQEIPTLKANPILFQVSEPPFNYEHPEWGTLQGKVAVWIPKFYDFWQDVDYLGKHVISQRLTAGEEVWAYTSLVVDFSTYKKLNIKANPATGNYPPVWQLDFPAINYRLPAWLFHSYGITGLGYWDTVGWYKGADVWNNAASFISNPPVEKVFNGDGLLIYPGTVATIGYDGPVASLRLKWIRESIEDYMYIDLLEKAGEGKWARQQIERFARNWGDWDNDPKALMQVRQLFGERLNQLMHQH